MADPARMLLLYAVFPMFVAAGFADWVCHRATCIATTSGLRENLLHQVMFVQIGCGIAAVALLEVNAAVLAIVAAVFVLHEITVWVDLRSSVTVRRVTPVEQMVHSVMEMLPLAALGLLAVSHWEQALALAGVADAPADWRLRWKAQPLPASTLLAGAALATVFNALPLAQETWSCLRARHAG